MGYIESRHQQGLEEKGESYCKQLPVVINHQVASAFIDPGNVWSNAISEGFFKTLGFSHHHLRRMKTGAAMSAGNKAMVILGVPKIALRLTVQPLGTHYKFLPVVVRGLTMDINISRPWMKEKGWEQLCSEDCLRINGKKVALFGGAPGEEPILGPRWAPQGIDELYRTDPRARASLYVDHQITILPDQRQILTLRAEEVQNGKVSYGKGVVTGEVYFQDSVAPERPKELSWCSEEGYIVVSIRNTKSQPITIGAGQRFGSFVPIIDDKEEEDPSGKDQGKVTRDDPELSPSGSAGSQEEVQTSPTVRSPGSYTTREKRKWLQDNLHLRGRPCIQTQGELEKALDTLIKFWDFFSHDGTFGKTHLMEHQIKTRGTPIKDIYLATPPALLGPMKQQLHEWLEQGIIEPANSPWKANMVADQSRNQIRWGIDWRLLNTATHVDPFPGPSSRNDLTVVANSTIFSTISWEDANHCMDLSKEDKPKTAFSTPFGAFQYTRLGLGMANGTSSHRQMVDRVLKGIQPSSAIGFLDDGVVHSTDLETHLENLEETLAAFRRAGLRIPPHKCSFFLDKVVSMGHQLSNRGVAPVEPYAQAIEEWVLPSTRQEAKAFLDVASYYNGDIGGGAQLSQSWEKAHQSSARSPLMVTKKMEKEFQEIKNRLVSAPIMGPPRGVNHIVGGRFTLDTDFCTDQISGILSQQQAGKEVVIAYGSKMLKASQQKWHPTRGELFAGMHFMDQYQYFLRGGPVFIWRTDCQAFRGIHSMKCPSESTQMERWLTHLAKFNFVPDFRPGTDHGNADGLSKSRLGGSMGQSREDQEMLGGSMGQSREDEEMRTTQNQDEDLFLIKKWIKKDAFLGLASRQELSGAGRAYVETLDSMRLSVAGILSYIHPNKREQGSEGSNCLPAAAWAKLVKTYHTHGHLEAVDKLTHSIRFPAMPEEVKNCLEKASRGLQERTPEAVRRPNPGANRPFQEIYVDFMGVLHKGLRTGAAWVVTATDGSTRRIEAGVMMEATATQAIQTLEKEVFSRYGRPRVIHINCRRQMRTEMANQMVTNLKLYAPTIIHYVGMNKKNQMDMSHQLESTLRVLDEQEPGTWDSELPHILYKLRAEAREGTKEGQMEYMEEGPTRKRSPTLPERPGWAIIAQKRLRF